MGARDLIPEHPAELTLLDYLCGSLAPARSDQVRKHIATCRDCRQTMAELSSTVDDLDRLPTTGFFEGRGDDSHPHRRPSLRVAPVVALAILLLGALVWLRLDQKTAAAPEPPSTVRIDLPTRADSTAVSGFVREATALPIGSVRVVADGDHPGQFLVLVTGKQVKKARAALAAAASSSPKTSDHATLEIISTGSELPAS